MDNLRGFLRYPRQGPVKQPVEQRVRHWREYVQSMPDAQALRQGARCMDCGIPYCHAYCPVNNLIPDWNALVSERHWRAAWRALDSTNNFPELTGRLCPAPCEHACTLMLSGGPVTIKALERAIADRAWERGWVRPHYPKGRRSERVAVVGSGPAGLACAQQLARVGYRVTLYEKADRPGGLLRYGIPDFRLEKRLLDRRLAQLRAEGVVFRTGVHVGCDPRTGAMLDSADAVVLACGCEYPRRVALPSPRCKGIHFALDYLAQQNHRVAGDPIEPEAAILAGGKDVVVIGGGDTGCDCVGTAIRQGARSVTQIQYHERPPDAADILMHWPLSAPTYRESDTEQEGCKRLWSWNTVGLTEDSGRVSGLLMQRVQWGRHARRHDFGAVEGETRHLPAQLVLIAIGYAHPVHEGLLKDLQVDLDGRGNVEANDLCFLTSRPGVFACGDVRRGQSLLVWAIREGRRCARAVDLWLAGGSELPVD